MGPNSRTIIPIEENYQKGSKQSSFFYMRSLLSSKMKTVFIFKIY